MATAVVDPLPATIGTIIVLGVIMLLPLIVYFRVVLSFACNKSLQAQLNADWNNTTSASKQGDNSAIPLPTPPPVLLTFSNITYTVRKTKHAIVRGVSGWFAPKTLTAILGTSGCGKTTLLSVLADQMDPTGVSTGEVIVNAKSTKQINFRQMCAYVLQSDNLMESLTVREFLWFAAELRLHAKMSQTEKMLVVNLLLDDLDLQSVANRFIHLLSGGQKRRVTVACELVSRPSMVFLDEPTSGLDASGSLKLVRVLRKLADQGRTVVATIHQPRIDAFNLFHMMLLMNQGEALYFGPVSKVISFMRPANDKAALGNGEEEEVENPADFVLDLTHGAAEQVAELVLLYKNSELCSRVNSTVSKINSGVLQPGESFAAADDDEAWFPDLQRFPSTAILAEEEDGDDENKDLTDDNVANQCRDNACDCCGWYYVFAYASSFLKQHFTLTRRSLLNEWRNKSYIMTWVMGVIMMLFMGMLYCYVSPPPLNPQLLAAVEVNLQQYGACTESLQDLNQILNLTNAGETISECGYDLNHSNQLDLARSSLLYQLLASMFFSEMPMIAIMYQDRQLFLREHASKSYSTFSWVLSWVSKLTFAGLVKGLVFPPFVYFSAQLTLSAEAYFMFSIFMGIMSIAGSTFALLAVVCFASPESATVAFVCLNVVAQNLSGYFIAISYIPWWFRWAVYFNFFTYTYEGMLLSQKLSPENWNLALESGQKDEYNLNEFNAWVDALVAVMLCVAFQLLAFVVLAASGGNQLRKRATARTPCGNGQKSCC